MSAVRATALRAGGACVRCRKGKTKCVYENGRAPCKNCSKGMHECYLPSESMSHGGHGVSPARVTHRVREALPSERASSGGAGAGDPRHGPAHSTAVASRNAAPANEKYVSNISFFFSLSCSLFSSVRSFSLSMGFYVSTDAYSLLGCCFLFLFLSYCALQTVYVGVVHHILPSVSTTTELTPAFAVVFPAFDPPRLSSLISCGPFPPPTRPVFPSGPFSITPFLPSPS